MINTASEQKLLAKIRQLSPEKITAVETFIDSLVRQNTQAASSVEWNEDIAAMANDPEIQAELAAINLEFAIV